jgi:hypothetical protein
MPEERDVMMRHLAALMLACWLAAVACESDRPGRSERATLTLDSFVASPGAVNGDAIKGQPEETAAPDESSVPEDNDAIEVVTDGAPPPPVAAPPRVEPGTEVVLDSLVGQINGRPVFADAFFAPIDAKLRLAAEQNSRFQFIEILKLEIAQHLRDILESELILARAQSQLTEQQQMGLFAFLEQQRTQFVLETGGGSAEEARRQLLEEEGITMDDFMEQERQRALIQLVLQQEIQPRIVISWKDIEREYEDNYAKYNPPSQARITVIWIDMAEHAELIDEVKSRLEGGEAFKQVWESIDPGYRLDNTYMLPTGALSDASLVDAWKQHLVPLSAGETSAPFEHVGSTGETRQVWLHVADISAPPGRSIYEESVQLELRQQIFNRRFAEERLRYMEEQLGEAVMKDIGDMAQRLQTVGERRYLP